MSAAAADHGFVPVFPERHDGRLPLVRLIRTLRENSIGTWTNESFERDIMVYRMGFKPMIVANHPDLIRHVMLDSAANYERDPVGKRLLEPGLGKGLLTSEGQDWKRQRRMMAPIFQPRRLAGFAAIMTERSAILADRLSGNSGAAPVDMAREMMLLTLDIIAQTMFGADSGTDVSAVGAAMDHYQATVRPNIPDLLGLPRWIPRPSAREGRAALQQMDTIIRDLIRRRRERAAAGGDPGGDLLGLLLAAVDEEGGGRLDDREVRDQMATFFLAGHETTATALAWTWYLLANAPPVLAKLEAELDTVLAGRPAEYADYEKLTYTRMVIEEAMRLYPPAHTTARLAIADDRFGDLEIVAGTNVIISPWLMHRHRLYWTNPDTFDPENFAPERAASRRRYTYLPFGAGPRICIGQGFAMIEAVLILATLAQRIRARLQPGAIVRPVGKITLRPMPGLPMLIEPRRA